MISQYAIELAGLMAVFVFVIVSPGADTAMVMRQTLMYGRRTGIFTAAGVGVSLLFHLTYTILGLGVIVANSLLLFSLIKWAGAAYLIYMGVQALRSPSAAVSVQAEKATTPGNDLKSFGVGFLTNALNPKPILFFLSLFSVLVSVETPALVKGVYAVVMAVSLIGWFSLVACFLTVPKVRAAFDRASVWINRATGALFIGLGVKLALSRAE